MTKRITYHCSEADLEMSLNSRAMQEQKDRFSEGRMSLL